jgi:DNA-cytosine methyltransferase
MNRPDYEPARRMVNVGEAIGGLPEPYYDTRSRKEIREQEERDRAEILSREWEECEIVEWPRKGNDAATPRVLVRRKIPPLTDAEGNECGVFEGYPCISIFSGIGGFELGMEQVGYNTVVQHEMDYNACGTLLANRPGCFRHAALIQGDIYKTPTEMLLAEGGLRVGEAHILTGGPPCQGFSFAGVRDPKDPRNNLIFEYLRVVREAQPKFFIMENVAGILSAKGGPKNEPGDFLRRYLRAAYDCFYELVYGLIDCCEYGVPQHRVRFICMGTRRDMFALDGVLGSLPAPACFGSDDLQLLKLIEGVPGYEAEVALLRHPPGIRYFPDRPMLIPPTPIQGISGEGRTKRFLKFYGDLREREPDRIVTTDTEWELKEQSLIITP